MKKTILSLIALVLTFSAASFSQAEPLRTIVDIPTKSIKGLVVIAPAKKYLMEERLFKKLSDKLVKAGYISIRFNWDSKTLANPATELSLAEEEILKVVQKAQLRYSMSPRQTAIIAKSFSTKALYPSLPYAFHYVLLTPNCSVEAPFVHVYGRFLQRTPSPSTIVISNEDPYCDVRQIYAALATAPRPLSLFTTYGDHNFVIPPPAGPKVKTGGLQILTDEEAAKKELKEEAAKSESKKEGAAEAIAKDSNDYSFQDLVVDLVAKQIEIAL